jgi:two-component system, cell cycle sensor histidine kinase and response regulator CckA
LSSGRDLKRRLSLINNAILRFSELKPWQGIGVFASFVIIMVALVVFLGLPDELLYFGVLPLTLSALSQTRRRTHLIGAALLVLGSLLAVGLVSSHFAESAKTVMASGLIIIALCELIFSLSTTRRNAESERTKLQESLLQSQKMEAVGRLAGGIAHDFNNVLTAVQGYTELLLLEFDQSNTTTRSPDSEIHFQLSEILSASNRAKLLTRQLLAFGRKQIAHPSNIRLDEALSGIESMLRRLIGENIWLEMDLGADSASILADPNQVEQIVVNLAVNARDAMPDGGKLAFSVGKELRAGSAEDPHGMSEWVVLRVSDTGIGMTEEVKSHLFEPYFTTKDLGKGTGLGFATIYTIVDQLGGFIEVKSQLHHGTTVSIFLPGADDRLAATGTKSGSRRMRAGRGTILVVEDEEQVRNLVCVVLDTCGYEVVCAETPKEALNLAEQHGAIDLLVTDVVMPEMSGPEVADRFMQICPEAAILFVSGYTDGALVARDKLPANTDFLPKPFSPAKLSERVEDILSRDG